MLTAAVALWLSLGAPATGLEARVDGDPGAPRLMVNGEPVAPWVFFPNLDIPGEWPDRFLQQQVELSRRAGVHLYSFPVRVPRVNGGRDPDYDSGHRRMDSVLRHDPDARFILRLFPGPWPFWAEWQELPEGEISVFADGSRNFISMASAHFRELGNRDLVDTIRAFEEGPHGERILGYHVGAPDSEMFMDRYREAGPDLAPANQRGFRAWLRDRYPSDEALRKAWGRPDIALDTATVPHPEPGRFPMHGKGPHDTARIFYDVPEEQDWIDFSAYCSDLAADRIVDWAGLIKRETDRRKLAVFFYGYTFELCGSFSGHEALAKVLACPDVDALASPYSYIERLPGGPGAFMSPLDSVSAHGKLWFNEDDTRTHLLDPATLRPGIDLWQGDKAESLGATKGMLDRNLAGVAIHRAGMWWMDLMAGGAFNDRRLWEMLEHRAGLTATVYAAPSPYRPEVALLVDERSKRLLRSDWDATFQNLMRVRDEAMRAGAAVGFYLLSDFASGVVPPCKAYLFPNAFGLADEEVRRIRSRIESEGATALWLYAPACMGPNGFDEGRVQELTGIRVRRHDGRQGSTGEGPLAGLGWGWEAHVSPRLVVDDPRATILGRYTADDGVSAAAARLGTARSVLLADLTASREVLRELFRGAGAHIWTEGGEVLHTDGQLLAVHSGPGGAVTLNPPRGAVVEVLAGAEAARGEGALVLDLQPAETVWLRVQGP